MEIRGSFLICAAYYYDKSQFRHGKNRLKRGSFDPAKAVDSIDSIDSSPIFSLHPLHHLPFVPRTLLITNHTRCAPSLLTPPETLIGRRVSIITSVLHAPSTLAATVDSHAQNDEPRPATNRTAEPPRSPHSRPGWSSALEGKHGSLPVAGFLGHQEREAHLYVFPWTLSTRPSFTFLIFCKK